MLTPTRAWSGVRRPGHALKGLEETEADTHRPLRVVLVHGGHAEDANHGIADELLDCAAVGLDCLGGADKVIAEQSVDVLGVSALAHCCEGDEVAEECCDDLAFS